MLILSKEYVEEHGGDPATCALAGQENNGGVWSISKMNMLLHGIPDADIRNNDDTLADPVHIEGGELKRFDRVITNPPFSLNYAADGMPFPERFRYGWTPEGGKKADLMFVQHMLSVTPAGRHGRDGHAARRAVPRRRRARDPHRPARTTTSSRRSSASARNLFYGTGIPACILVLRAAGREASGRAGARCCSSTPTASSPRGRAQNYLLPEHVEKIVSAYRAFADIPGFARVVTRDELAENDDNLNIRRYADNTPPPEPQDVRAHLHGGIPEQRGRRQGGSLHCPRSRPRSLLRAQGRRLRPVCRRGVGAA